MKDIIVNVEQKRKRVPLDEQRDQLKVHGLDEDSYHYRWVNDEGDRISKFLTAGYGFVQTDGVVVGDQSIDWTKPKFSIVSRGVGGGLTAFLMGIPLEFYKEDQQKKQKKIDELEASIFEQANKQGFGGAETWRKTGRY